VEAGEEEEEEVETRGKPLEGEAEVEGRAGSRRPAQERSMGRGSCDPLLVGFPYHASGHTIGGARDRLTASSSSARVIAPQLRLPLRRPLHAGLC
jgi:hypothetical protein